MKEFFDKAVARKKEHGAKGTEKGKNDGLPTESHTPEADMNGKPDEGSDEDEKMELSEDEAEEAAPEMATSAISATPLSPAAQLINGDRPKRKRSDEGESNDGGMDDVDSTPSKRLRSETPPPPPPPPEEQSPGTTTPSNAHDPSESTNIGAATKHGHTMDDVDMDPRPSAPKGPVYTEQEQTSELNGADTPPMFLNGMSMTPSDGDEVDMDQSNPSIRGDGGLGIGQMPELQVHQGH